MGVSANNDVDARNRCSQLLVGQVAGVTDGHDDVDSISLQLADLLCESFDLVIEQKSRRHIGGPDGFGSEVTHKADLSSAFLNHKGFPSMAVEQRHTPSKEEVFSRGLKT